MASGSLDPGMASTQKKRPLAPMAGFDKYLEQGNDENTIGYFLGSLTKAYASFKGKYG